MARLPGAFPVRVELTTELEGPAELVWELLTDWERQDEWMLEASDFAVTTAQREGVGVEAEATIRIAGIRTRDRIRVVGWRPPEHLAIEHLGWVSGAGVIDLTAINGGTGTRLDWVETLACPALGAIGSLGLLATRPLMRSVFERDLRVLAALVRARQR